MIKILDRSLICAGTPGPQKLFALHVAIQNDVNEKGVNGFRSSENGESLVSGGC
jgi:hypothetical protein